jgi:hypothetical protein
MNIKEYLSELNIVYNEKMENEEEIKRLINKRDYFDKKILEITKNFMETNQSESEQENVNV